LSNRFILAGPFIPWNKKVFNQLIFLLKKTITVKYNGERILRYSFILPSGSVKIRYYGIYSSRFRSTLLKGKIIVTLHPDETVIERIKRLTGFDISTCPRCKKGKLVFVGIMPLGRSPTMALPYVA
jgi:hypothetical protein